MKLPRSLDELQGLRAARWIRESTRGQWDNLGPDAQRYQQDIAVERYGLVDTGIVWQVAHSGRTVGETHQFSDMLARAGKDYDVLLVGYTSRFTRHLKRTLVAVEDHLHPSGAVVLFCDESALSSDSGRWDDWVREAHEAESYSRKLAKRISEGYEAKFRRLTDQGGSAPWGFRRTEERPHALVVDPDEIRRVVAAFERYAGGSVSLEALGDEFDVKPAALRETLKNPIYNGWARRGHELRPAAWRANPPVSDELWARVQEIRQRRYTGGGHPTPRHVHLLAGRLFCACGVRIRASSKTDGKYTSRRYRHHEPCEAWPQETYTSRVFEEPIAAQLSQLQLTERWRQQLRQLAGVPQARPDGVALRRRHLQRELEERAAAHAARRISTEQYLAEHTRLTAELDAIPRAEAEPLLDADRAWTWANDLARAWKRADEKERADLVAAVYDRITVAGDTFVSAELTPDAYRHGLALAMRERVLGARPAGVGHAPSIPIVGRRDYLRLLRTA